MSPKGMLGRGKHGSSNFPDISKAFKKVLKATVIAIAIEGNQLYIRHLIPERDYYIHGYHIIAPEHEETFVYHVSEDQGKRLFEDLIKKREAEKK